MTPEFKAKWLDALRSGKYQQGQGTLNRDGKMCCLGVLCDIAGYEWRQVENVDDNNHYSCVAGIDYIENEAFLDELGLSKEIHEACYSINDGTLRLAYAAEWGVEKRAHTFTEIADWLEKQL